MRDVTALILGGLFGAAIALLFGWGERPASLTAGLLCAPLETTVGRPIRCVDLSTGAERVALDGPDGPIPILGGGADIVFSAPGEQALTLRASRGERVRKAATVIHVAPRAPIAPPLILSLSAPQGDDAVITEAHQVEERFAGSADGPSQRSVVRRWPAREGYRMARIRMEQMRMTGLGALSAKVVDDGAAAELSFTLRAGTPARPEEARLFARIVLEQTPLAGAGGPIADPVRIDAEGLWSVPGAWPEPPDRLLVLDAEGRALAEGPPGATLVIEGRPYAVTVSPADGVTLLDVRRIDPDARRDAQ